MMKINFCLDRNRLQDTRYVLPAILALWGLWLIIFTPFESSPSYRTMANVAPDGVWGLGFFVTGLFGLLGVLWADYGYIYQIEVLGNSVVTGGWSMIVIMVMLGNPLSTGFLVYGIFVILGIVNCLCAAVKLLRVYRPA